MPSADEAEAFCALQLKNVPKSITLILTIDSNEINFLLRVAHSLKLASLSRKLPEASTYRSIEFNHQLHFFLTEGLFSNANVQRSNKE